MNELQHTYCQISLSVKSTHISLKTKTVRLQQQELIFKTVDNRGRGDMNLAEMYEKC